jgi:hypothetical protein
MREAGVSLLFISRERKYALDLRDLTCSSLS